LSEGMRNCATFLSKNSLLSKLIMLLPPFSRTSFYKTFSLL
jgi:hypothetical protein